jgi:signal transduction histidine kinase
MGRRVAVLAWVATVIMAAVSLAFLARVPPRTVPGDLFRGVSGASSVLMSLTFTTIGAVVVAKVPGNRIGWLFSLIGVLTAVTTVTYQYAMYGLYSAPHGLPGSDALAWISGTSSAQAPMLGFALLLFPDGHLPSRRWIPAAAIGWLSIVLFAVAYLFRPGPLDDPFGVVSNPTAIPGSTGAMNAMVAVAWILTVTIIAVGAVSMVVRLRRAKGVERQQLKLVLAVGAVVGAVVVATMSTWYVGPEPDVSLRMATIGLAFAIFPVAAGIAILRYRLYDVDLVISKTVVYGVVTVLLAAAYAATALLLGTALGRGSAWTTAGATLTAALAFLPVRARVQDAVDRRFRRARYDALHRVASFLDEVRAGRAAPEGIEPLLRELVADPTLELRYFLPESQLYVDAAGVPAADSAQETRRRTPIERAGLPIAMVLHDQPADDNPDLLPRLIEAGGLAVEIVRLRVELRRQLAEVEASRARIVAAGFEERRRIERDLHDGAQQRLVTVGLALRHLQHEFTDNPADVSRSLDSAVDELSAAIQELRELARGLPPSQLDAGLEPALRELASRSPVPVEVRASGARPPANVEATAYFVACEGLTNAVKHANASKVVLSAARHNGSLIVSVVDNGVGGAERGGGSGLRGLEDRIAAHGGTLDISSDPGTGTTLTAELPCGS